MQLKRYAEIQENITTWKTDEAGYVLNGSALSDRWWESEGFDGTAFMGTFLIVSNVLAVIITLVVLYILHSYHEKIKSRNNYKLLMYNSVHWITVAVIAQFNIMFLSADFAQVVVWCQSDCVGVAALKLIWFVYLLVLVLVSLTCSLLFYKDSSGIEVWNILVCAPCAIFSFFFSCVLCVCNPFQKPNSSRASKCVIYLFRAIYFPTIYVFISLVSGYLLPVVFQLLVYPFKVIPAYSFLIAALVLYILIATYGDYKRKLWSEAGPSHTFTICEPSFYLIMAPLNVMFIAIMMSLFIVAYKALMAGGLSDNPVLHSFFSLLPSIILSALIWLFKRKVLNKSAVDGDTQTNSTDGRQLSESATASSPPARDDDQSSESNTESDPLIVHRDN